ncbi:ATP-dependent helicase HrpB [Aliamphritea spongicola]|uniref:ATP-dependent helicase HrpB n=1 Tax=Aliamphritea spongicola TaxID=707589 RepID=UPI00196A6154|nr:ATP-dependent helicase HrpB [Aliamphritea spongicola]MBN3563323.1 ATP-dependent helicase HrpB [Aliamphritea spongicola]
MTSLPIYDVLDELTAALINSPDVILEAPPGAGKTTCVPLALLQEEWLQGQKIVMLEPRRLAARAAAQRMASVLDEKVGETVGYRVRLESAVGPATRIEVVTEGILVRMLQEDPSLEGVGLVIFDEFHERNLDADLGLALCLQGRELFREDQPLRLLIMSATLDGAQIQQLLPAAPLVSSAGRMYPVDVEYLGYRTDKRLEEQVSAAVRQALETESGSILVFLPGQAEIRRAAQQLADIEQLFPQARLLPLFGDLDFARQQRAIAPAKAGERKIVLATSIAETSLTIDGVRVVIDAGLSRYAAFDPNTGMSRLHTRRLSRAASIQRSGRAGRTEPGICYRLWSREQQDQLAPHSDPEITNADLVPLVLQLQLWGVSDPAELAWLDMPPAGAVAQAEQLLMNLSALVTDPVTGAVSITSLGEQMAALPVHPRLARMLIIGAQQGQLALAADIAALLSERSGIDSSDFSRHLAWLQGDIAASSHTAQLRKRCRQLAGQFSRLVRKQNLSQENLTGLPPTDHQEDWLAILLSYAYPDRIAARRNPQGHDYLLSNGRAARLKQHDPLHKSEFLVIAEQGGRQGQSVDQIYSAVTLNKSLFDGPLKALTARRDKVEWDTSGERLRSERQVAVGAIVLQRADLPDADPALRVGAILSMLAKRGLHILNWEEATGLRQRLAFLHQQDPENWPDVSDAALTADLEVWLGPYLDNVRQLSQLKKLNLQDILLARLSWEQQQALNNLAPVSIKLPAGSNARLDYSQSPPVLAVRLQEMFGCTTTPTIGRGTAVMLHLLSPARRPLQVTQDLESFWQNSYREVQKDMKGRYPKHYWPDNPLEADPGHSLKKRRSD